MKNENDRKKLIIDQLNNNIKQLITEKNTYKM